MQEYAIADLSLAESGKKKIEWVREHMPLLQKIRTLYQDEKPFSNQKVALSIHLEAKTAYMALVFRDLGADVSITGSNPLSTQDDVAAALVEERLRVFAKYDCSDLEYENDLKQVLAVKPNVVIDDGGDLVHLLHAHHARYATQLIGGCEETTTGVLRLRALEKQKKLQFPMIAVNDAQCKYLFDNRYGTGQSVWDGINRTTNLIVAGKTVVVAGYGWCGKGVAMRAKGFGARVVVTEVDPIKACEAYMDGFEIMSMDQACVVGDLFITVTGCKDVIGERHFKKMKNGAILCNAGHFNVEINMEELRQASEHEQQMKTNIRAYHQKDKRTIYVLAEGRLVNLAAGDGHAAEIMDMSFALQMMSAKYLIEKRDELQNKVYHVPEEIDREVAKIKLENWNKNIDVLTKAQAAYLESWDGL